jgi:hypothetical protein
MNRHLFLGVLAFGAPIFLILAAQSAGALVVNRAAGSGISVYAGSPDCTIARLPIKSTFFAALSSESPGKPLAGNQLFTEEEKTKILEGFVRIASPAMVGLSLLLALIFALFVVFVHCLSYFDNTWRARVVAAWAKTKVKTRSPLYPNADLSAKAEQDTELEVSAVDTEEKQANQ